MESLFHLACGGGSIMMWDSFLKFFLIFIYFCRDGEAEQRL